MKSFRFYIPTTKWDLLRRSAIRIACCAVPYLLLTRLLSIFQDDGLFHGWWFFWCVVAIPGVGLALDVWRLMQARGVEQDTP